MTIEIWLLLALCISITANGILIWFSKKQTEKLLFVAGNVFDLVEMIESYRKHLKAVYSLDTFYGDETLMFLLEHTGNLVSVLEQQYGDIIQLTDPTEMVSEEEDEETEEEEPQEQDVLYGGTRRGDT